MAVGNEKMSFDEKWIEKFVRIEKMIEKCK